VRITRTPLLAFLRNITPAFQASIRENHSGNRAGLAQRDERPKAEVTPHSRGLGPEENPGPTRQQGFEMSPSSLGRVNVPTPGTAVPLATTYTKCARIRVSVVAGLTGKMYLGTKAVVGSTLVGVIKELWPNSAGGVDDFYEITSGTDSDMLNLADYAIDAVVAGEGLIVSYWTA
jgi:hypothetical protein